MVAAGRTTAGFSTASLESSHCVMLPVKISSRTERENTSGTESSASISSRYTGTTAVARKGKAATVGCAKASLLSNGALTTARSTSRVNTSAALL